MLFENAEEYRLFALGPSCLIQWIMIFTQMQFQEMFRGKVVAASRTSMRVSFGIVGLEFLEGSKGQGLGMRRQGASHHCSEREGFAGVDVFLGFGDSVRWEGRGWN